MRSNGDGGERLLARFTAEDHVSEDEDAAREERDVAKTLATLVDAVPSRSTGGSKGAKSRAKAKNGSKSQAPASAPHPVPARPAARLEKQAEKVASEKPAPKPSKRPQGKKAKTKSIAPKTQRGPGSTEAARASSAPASLPVPSSSAPPSPSAPPSLDPRTTLRDHPVQKSAAAAARAATSPRREDEISIPPTSSDPPVAGDLDDRFFAEGEAAAHAAHAEAIGATKVGVERFHPEEHESHRPIVVASPERRRKLTNYVKLAVGFSGVLLLAAAVRVGVSHVVHPAEASAPATHVMAIAAPPVAVPPPLETAPSLQAPPAVVEDAPAVVDEPAPPPARSAKQEKESARAALEHGKRKDAVEAAQRSVDLDPTDAEAWLILGSAQQESGKWKDARESFVSCTKQAKLGPIGECRMMLR
jgi:hypothetical protein